MSLQSRLNFVHLIKQYRLERLFKLIDRTQLNNRFRSVLNLSSTTAAQICNSDRAKQQTVFFPNKINVSTSTLIRDLLDSNRSYRKWFNSIIRSLSSEERKNVLVALFQNDPRSLPPEPGTKNRFENEQRAQQNSSSGKGPEAQEPQDSPQWVKTLITVVTIAFVYTLLSGKSQRNTNAFSEGYISWNEFVQDMLAKGEVAEVILHIEQELAYIKLHPEPVVKGRKLFDRDTFVMKISNVEKFEEKLRKAESDLNIDPSNRILVSYTRSSQWAPLFLLASLAFIFYLFIKSRLTTVKFPNPMDALTKAKFTMVDPHIKINIPTTTFADVAGMKEAKLEVMEFVDYIKSPQRFMDLGAKVPKGALLLGPPGIGKTLLAKAVAAEAGVPFLSMAGSEFVEVIGGLGAARVRDLFREAHKRSPCIIYVDEIDAIGKKRRGEGKFAASSSEEEHTLNQLLVEMDGLESRSNVIMLASTNRPDVLDKALLRPGRFDRHILIDYPTLEERVEILEVYLKKLKLEKDFKSYSRRLAQLTPGMSGADLANICNEAALHAARLGKPVIASNDFEAAVERVIAGSAKQSNTMAPSEKRTVAYHESGHVLVGWLLKTTCLPLKVTIVPRTGPALGFAQYMPKDKKLLHEEEFDEDLCVMLAGRVAEQIIFNTVSTGAQDDLQRATKLAYAQIRQFGMSKTIGLISFPSDRDNPEKTDFGVKPYSKKLQRMMDEEAQQRLANAFKKTERLLEQNRSKLETLAEELLKRETLNYDDIVKLIGPSPYPNKQKIDIVDWEAVITTPDPSKVPPPPESLGGSGQGQAGQGPPQTPHESL